MVDVLTRMVVTRLRQTAAPTQSDFEATARALDVIRTLEPNDVDLLRRSIEAWSAAGDPETELARVRELLTLDPGDTYSQLRVTLASLAKLQTADARLAAYANILGDRGRAIDPAVRSRIALDAALLARDNGDDRLFLEDLTLATTLDPTNKEAAALYAGALLQATTDPDERVDILCNVVLSDPLDPNAYENLGLELLQYGAFAGALRAFQLSSTINTIQGGTLDEGRIFDFALCEWNVQGPEIALNRLAKVLGDSIRAYEAERQAIRDDGREPPNTPEPLLPPRLQLLQLAIAASEKSDQSKDWLKAILADYTKAHELVLASFQKQLDNATTDEQKLAVETQVQVYRLQRLWAQLAAGDELDDAESFLTELEEQRKLADENGPDPTKPPPLAAEVLQRYRGWLAVMQLDDLKAQQLLEPLVEKDHLARWAMGLLKEEQGLTAEAMKHYAILARDQPTTAIGTTAFFRLQRLVDKPIIRSALAESLNERVLAFAPWLESVINDPMRFMSARVTIDPAECRALDRPVINITIRNVSRWPLGVGTGRPIPRRMLLAPRIRRDGREVTENTVPFVALIESRLRLTPAESVSVNVNPMREDLGRLLDNTATARYDARWQLLQNFVSDDGAYKASPLTITTQSDVLTRLPLSTDALPDELADRIATDSGASLVDDALIASSMIIARSSRKALDDASQASERSALAAALVERIPTLPPVGRTLLLARCVEIGLHNDAEFHDKLESIGTTETDPLPLLAAVVGLAWSTESPVFEHAETSGVPEVARIATLYREAIQIAADRAAKAAQDAEDAKNNTPDEDAGAGG